MRRDLIIGVFLSVVIHVAVFFGDQLIPRKVIEEKKVEEKSTLEIVQMPELEPEEPEIVEATTEEVKPLEFAPPMQADLPQLATESSFVQKVQPPPPEGLKPAANMMTIPAQRDMSQFRGVPVFNIADLDQQPQPRVRTPPNYPYEMRRAGTTGEVLVDFIVDTDGRVQNAAAIRSTHREFEQPAVQAVSKWTFRAGRKGGRAVNVHMQVPIVFQLNEDQ